MQVVSYQVEHRQIGAKRGDYWGVVQEGFTTPAEATDSAREDCPAGWAWRVVRVRLDVVAEGQKAEVAPKQTA